MDNSVMKFFIGKCFVIFKFEINVFFIRFYLIKCVLVNVI